MNQDNAPVHFRDTREHKAFILLSTLWRGSLSRPTEDAEDNVVLVELQTALEWSKQRVKELENIVGEIQTLTQRVHGDEDCGEPDNWSMEFDADGGHASRKPCK